MDATMFCYQCEQTFLGKACTGKGACGKDTATSNSQDDLAKALISLAVAAAAKARGIPGPADAGGAFHRHHQRKL